MAYFFGTNVGSGIGPTGVLAQSTTTSRDVEVVINTNANVPSKQDLVMAVTALLDYIQGKADKNW